MPDSALVFAACSAAALGEAPAWFHRRLFYGDRLVCLGPYTPAANLKSPTWLSRDGMSSLEHDAQGFEARTLWV